MRVDFWQYNNDHLHGEREIASGTYSARTPKEAESKADDMMPSRLRPQTWRHKHHNFQEKADHFERFVIQIWRNS